MQKILGYMRKAIQEFDLIQDGDRIAVGVSGGKDSLALLLGLIQLRRFIGIDYELVAITLDPMFGGVEGDYSAVARLCEENGVEYVLQRTHIGEIVFDIRKEPNPCSLCAKFRRGALSTTMNRLGLNKIALGHHQDDAVETMVMSLFLEGRVSCFQPVTYLDRTQVTQIRPMLYVQEREVRGAVRRLNLPVVENPCPANGSTRREEMKVLLRQLEDRYPNLRKKIFGAIQRYPLYGWSLEEDQR